VSLDSLYGMTTLGFHFDSASDEITYRSVKSDLFISMHSF